VCAGETWKLNNHLCPCLFFLFFHTNYIVLYGTTHCLSQSLRCSVCALSSFLCQWALISITASSVWRVCREREGRTTRRHLCVHLCPVFMQNTHYGCFFFFALVDEVQFLLALAGWAAKPQPLTLRLESKLIVSMTSLGWGLMCLTHIKAVSKLLINVFFELRNFLFSSCSIPTMFCSASLQIHGDQSSLSIKLQLYNKATDKRDKSLLCSFHPFSYLKSNICHTVAEHVRRGF